MTAPAGWYDDTTQPGLLRYWDGTTWTQHTAPNSTAVSPAAVPAADASVAPAVGYDLAGNRPGQAARARAEAEHTARLEQVGKFRTWLGKVVDANTDERSWRVGADAEETVGQELERLRESGWNLLHSVPVGKGESDIDHVLISPTGLVLTVNTKHHPNAKVWVAQKQIRVNGQPVPYLRNSRYEAQRTARLLTDAAGFRVHTHGILIFRLRNGDLTIKQQPDGVTAFRATKAWKPIRDRMPSGGLDPAQVQHLYDVARRSTTWTR